MRGKPDAWMPLWVGDWLKDTRRLSLEEQGAYFLLVLDYWINGALPDDDATLARTLSVDAKTWRRLKPKLLPFFEISGGFLRQKRVEKELVGARERSAKAAAKAKAGAEARWEKERARSRDNASADSGEPDAPSIAPSTAPGIVQALPKHMPTHCPSPITLLSYGEAQAPGRDQEAWTRAVRLLVDHGRMKDRAARSFFGKLLKDTGLMAGDLLASVVQAEGTGTQDPASYLRRAADAVSRRKNGPEKPVAPSAEEWTLEHWETAVRRFHESGRWSDAWGPKPGEPGCRAPVEVAA